MRKRTGAFRLLSGFFSLLAIGTMAYGQAQVDMVKTITQYSNPPGLAAGTPEGSYVLSAAESMDSFGGHLNYELPLLHIGGRGSAGYTISLKIPSRWEASSHTHCDVTQNFGTVCTPTRYEALFGDWRSGTVEYGPGVVVGRRTGTYGKCTYLLVTPNEEQYRMTSTRTTIVFIDSHGSEHELFDTSSHGGQYVSPTSPAGACAEGSTMPNRGKIFASRDGSALTFLADSDVVDNATLTNGGVFSGRLLFPDGTVWRVNSIGRVTYIRDRFGNLTTFEYSASTPSELVKVTDPEGREVTFSYSQTLDTITYRKYLGGTHTISVGFAPLENVLRSDYASAGLQTYHELFSTANDWCAENSRPRSECLSNPWVPSLVTLPNSKLYQFRYNPYAELSEVLLPTGGRTEYDWAGGEANTLPDGYLGFEDLALIHRVVKQRRAYIASSGGTPAKETYYEPGSYFGVSASRVTTEAQRSLSAPRAILHYFNGSPTAGSFLQPGAEPYWNHGKEYYTEIQGGGSTSKKTDHEWVQLANLTPVLKSVTTKLPRSGGTEIWSKVENWYDSFANIVQTTETDWGSGAVGPVIRKKAISYVTATNYTHEGETNPANYVAHLRRLPLTETVYKVQSGVDTQQARREYVYDEAAYPVQTCSGISRHDTSLPPSPFDSTQYLADNPTRRNTSFTRFGNVTTARAWTAGSNYINTHAAYDIAGNTVQVIDGNNVTSTATYPSTNACAYPSTISISGTQTITASMQWDLNIGKMTSHTDVHNVTTSYGYEPYLGRMNSRTAASGTSDANTASLQYSDAVLNSLPPFTVTSKQDLTTGVQKESSKEYDGLGRLVWERQKTGGADIVVKTEYDALGRVSRRSIPASTPTHWETFAYDALDRVTSRQWADGAQEQTAYQLTEGMGLTADITKVTDPAGKWRIMVNDGLGRLIQVREPNPNNPSLPLDTTYTYNALDNLLTVNQSTRQRTFTYDGAGRLLTATNPESGTTTYAYDGNGNMTQKTDAESRVTTIAYDNLNRPLTKTYTGASSTPNVTSTYNGLRLTSVSTSDGITQAYTYSAGGRIATSTQTVGSSSYPFSYGYFMDGSLASVTYPSGRVVSYPNPDQAGRVKKVQGLLSGVTKEYVQGIDYNEHGLMGSMTLGNNLVERWTYSPKRLQPYDIRLGTSTVEDSAGRWKFSYCAGALAGADCTTNNGNVMNQQIQPLNIFQNYGYDALNRISVMEESASASATPACGAGTTPCRGFSYDDWSNMYVSATRVMSPASFTPTSSTNFNTANRLLIQSSAYDLAGNQTNIGGFAFAYDHEGRVKTSTLNSIATNYTYDGNGRRVTKSTGGSTTTFVYDASGNLAAEYGGTVTEGGARFLTADHLGSTRLVTKDDGTPDRRIDYLPFGEFMPATVGGRTTAMKYEATETLAALTQRFTGKERDAETGLDYFGARYMSSAQGRFTSPDPLLNSGRPWEPKSWNRYLLTLGNPLRFSDPTGLYEWDTTLGGACADKALSGGTCANYTKAQGKDIVRQRKNIRSQLKRLDKSKDASLRAVGAAIGSEGRDNGVTISMGAVTPGAAAQVSATRPLNLDANGNPELELRVPQGSEGESLFISLAHEGSHIWDAQSVARGDRPLVLHLETEMSAYQESIVAAKALGWSSVGPAGGTPFWSSSWSKVDQQNRPNREILKLLLASPIYAPKNSTVAYTLQK